MLKITPVEQALLAQDTLLKEQLRQANSTLRNLPNGYYLEGDAKAAAESQHAEAKQTVDQLTAELVALGNDPAVFRYALKMEFNKALAQSLPGGKTEALIDVAKEVLDWLTTDESMVGEAQLVKAAVILGLDTYNDPDIHKARARGVAARYFALIEAGLPDTLAASILIAEAGRALPAFKSKLLG